MTNIEIETLTINDKQAKVFASNIHSSIANYINSHLNEFLTWLIEKMSTNIIVTIDGAIEKNNNYKYSICNYSKEEQ